MPKVSVIVPVYNTEKYLRQCVDSILSQTFADFELILVNDGSKDDSGKICDEYAQKDSRIVVIHKVNGGVSSARNKGIDVAQGEWLTFVDSDDYISDTYLSDFPMDVAHDMEICGMKLFGAQKKTYCPLESKSYRENEMAFFCEKIMGKPYVTSPTNKIMKRKLLETHVNIRFDEKIRICEDTLFMILLLKVCSNVKLIEKSNYHYRYPENLVVKYRQNAEALSYNLRKLNDAVFELSDKFNFNPSDIIYGINEFYYSCFDSYLKNLNDENEIVSEWRKYRKYNLYRYKFKMTFKERIYLILSHMFPKRFYLRMRKFEMNGR